MAIKNYDVPSAGTDYGAPDPRSRVVDQSPYTAPSSGVDVGSGHEAWDAVDSPPSFSGTPDESCPDIGIGDMA